MPRKKFCVNRTRKGDISVNKKIEKIIYCTVNNKVSNYMRPPDLFYCLNLHLGVM